MRSEKSEKSILIVAAHPDDEILGVGGTAALHAAKGHRVETLILAEGLTSRDLRRDKEKRSDDLALLRQTAANAAEVLGLPAPKFGGLPDNRMDGIQLLDVIKIVEKVVNDVAPDIVYTHHGGDLNIDHRVTHQAVLTACRPVPKAPTRAIYTFETVSSTEWAGPDIGPVFQPQRYVVIDKFLEKKLEALALYTTEMLSFPHSRSLEAVEAVARVRGSQVGAAAAEAFVVVRDIVRG
ncbi:MAG: PIG-L family deacetylase [Alphaproteobacteria bacterium]|nr:PIG-L family deacetylase [Alphaproteobacteria bacterium]